MQDSIQLPAERGKQAEKYRKIRVLGEGSMGKAYLVQCAEDSQLYVMKRINLGNLGPKQHESALRQAQLHSTLNHPHIIQFKELYQTTGDKLCIVMQYAEGGDLEQLIEAQNGKLMSEQTVLSILVQICFGLQEVHSKRIIHRDLKPTNIFLSKNKDVKIGDFGISRTLDHTQLAATSMIGTPYYLSPEMVEGKPYSTKADIWALGVILYQLCSFKLPFDANSLPVLALKILKGSFPPIPNNYSKDMKTLVLQMLQVDQKKRPSIQAILMKPFVFKLLSKQQQFKLTSKQQQRQQLRREKQKLMKEEKIEKGQKAQKGEKDMKEKARKEKQDKRQEMRKQMREDLKKKRAGKQKQIESVKSPYPAKINSPEVPHQLKKSPHKQVHNVFKAEPIEKIKKQQPVKPWKNKKQAQKKDFTIQMYVSEQKVKQHREEQSNQQFKMQMFVDKKPEVRSPSISIGTIKQQGRKSIPLIGQEVQNYHYQSKNQDQKEQHNLPYEHDFQEEIQQEDELHQLMRNVQQLSKMFPNSKDIDLYEQSDNFDSTLQAPPQIQHQQALNNLKQLLSSQTLQQLREILQLKLGDSKFIQSYTIVKKHLDDYLSDIDKQLSNKNVKDRFNKQLLMAKLPFLTQKQFNENIDLIFTLLIYEEMEMQKCNSGMGDSKYERLL